MTSVYAASLQTLVDVVARVAARLVTLKPDLNSADARQALARAEQHLKVALTDLRLATELEGSR